MRITIHRGTDRIGGCVTEYEYDGWRLFVDYGEQLPGAEKTDKPLDVEGLTRGDLSKSALLLTHYHGNHIGRLHELSSELPIFIGKVTGDVRQYVSEHLRVVDEASIIISERLKTANTFSPGVEFKFGPFSIVPIVMDHSAFDAYAFRIEADGVKAFHTGDFLTHGFSSGKLPMVIEKHIGKVDYVVCEATNVNRPDTANESEHGCEHMHTGGHCDIESLNGLLEELSPKGVIPIHTDNPSAFAQYFSNRWPIILLNDGESINPISGRYCDDTDAVVLTVAPPTDEFHVVANDNNLRWWSLDQRHLGNFANSDDAKSILQATVYGSSRLLGYSVEEEEDLSPFCVEVYDKDFNLLNQYEWECHAPGEHNFQEMGWLKPGIKVLAIIREWFNVVVPCEIVGPITEEFLKAHIEADALSLLSYDEIKADMWDWDWDCVVVRPLVRLASEYAPIPELALVQRVDIFPYKEFDL